MNKKCNFPIFQEASELETDPYWKTLFQNISVNKTPKCLYISNGIILSSNKKKQFSFIIPDVSILEEEEEVNVDEENKDEENAENEEDDENEENAEEDDDEDEREVNVDEVNVEEEESLRLRNTRKFIEKIKTFLMDNTNLLSNEDNEKRKEEVNIKLKNNKEIELWTENKKKNIKEQHFINYTLNMNKRYKLSLAATRELFNIIDCAFKYKTHYSSDITLSNGDIKDIKDIVYEPELKRFINLRNYEEEEEKKHEKYLFYYWYKYVNNSNKVQ